VGFRRWDRPIAQRAFHPIDPANSSGALAAAEPPRWDGQTAARLRRRRARHTPPPRLLRIPFVLALALHVLLALVVWQALRTTLPMPARPNAALMARFVPIVLPERVPRRDPPRPGPPPAPRVVQRQRRVATAVPSQPHAATDVTTTATLYDRHGQPLLPAPAASTGTPDYVQRLPQGDAQVMRHANPLPYQATRLEKYFPPPGESAGGAAVRRLKDAVVGTKAVDLPGGLHLKCKTLLGIPTPNCVDPPAPPSAKDGDERLSMAPTRSLAADPQPPAKPALAECIAMYRAGKPLAWGCPVDTPDRAVDDELRRRAAGAAQH
jgi:hypothetical protein